MPISSQFRGPERSRRVRRTRSSFRAPAGRPSRRRRFAGPCERVRRAAAVEHGQRWPSSSARWRTTDPPCTCPTWCSSGPSRSPATHLGWHESHRAERPRVTKAGLTLSPQVARSSTAKPALIEFGLTISSVAALAEAGSARRREEHRWRRRRQPDDAEPSHDRLQVGRPPDAARWGNYRHFFGSSPKPLIRVGYDPDIAGSGHPGTLRGKLRYAPTPSPTQPAHTFVYVDEPRVERCEAQAEPIRRTEIRDHRGGLQRLADLPRRA